MTGPTVTVWSRAVRLLHAGLIASVALSTLGLVAFFGLHRPAGWTALGIVVARGALGLLGTGHARFADFVRGPRETLRYAGAVVHGHAPRHLGHNPLGGWMAIALMACVAGLALTGWLYTTDAFFGDATVESVHRGLAWTLLGLVATHVAGVLFTGRRHRENLVASMWHGRKRPIGANDPVAGARRPATDRASLL